VYEQLLSVPDIVAVLGAIGVLNTSGITASNEVGDTGSDAGAGVPEYLGGSTVVHGGGPDSENGVLSVDSSIVPKSLMLCNTGAERYIIILAPTTEGVEEKYGVFISLLNELYTSVGQEKAVTVVEGVADLEGVDGISTHGDGLFVDLFGGVSVLVHAVIEQDALQEVHA
jgi:hypothetical protein